MDGVAALLARLVAATALGAVAVVHVRLAPRYAAIGDAVTQRDLFYVQGAVAAVVALGLLVRPGRLAWLAAGAVGLVSLLAVVGTVYVAVPAFGPLPRVFEPIWYGEKVVAAVAAGVAVAAALLAPALPAGRRLRTARSRA